MYKRFVVPILLMLALVAMPLVSVGADSSLTKVSGQWNQLVIPADPSGSTLADLFGDELNIRDYETTWLVGRHDSGSGLYDVVESDESLVVSQVYRLIQITGRDVTLALHEGLPSASGSSFAGCNSSSGCIIAPLMMLPDRLAWTMLGAPLDEPVAASSFTFVREQGSSCLNGCTLEQASALGLVLPSLIWSDPVFDGYRDFSDTPVQNLWQSAWYSTSPDALGNNAEASLLIELPDMIELPDTCLSASCNEVNVSGPRIKWHPLTLDVSGPSASENDDSPNPFLDIRLNVTFTAPSGNQLVVPGFFASDGSGSGVGSLWRTGLAPDEAGNWSFVVSLKGGIDSQENFFGYAGFDKTVDQSGGAGTDGLQDGVHHFEPHIRG